MDKVTEAVAKAVAAYFADNPSSEYLDSLDLEELTGTKASTWRYWASIGEGPVSFKLGRRRVWKRSTVLEWLESQAAATA
jgi:predicted DNA-binding transcriptional regulator AlpA